MKVWPRREVDRRWRARGRRKSRSYLTRAAPQPRPARPARCRSIGSVKLIATRSDCKHLHAPPGPARPRRAPPGPSPGSRGKPSLPCTVCSHIPPSPPQPRPAPPRPRPPRECCFFSSRFGVMPETKKPTSAEEDRPHEESVAVRLLFGRTTAGNTQVVQSDPPEVTNESNNCNSKLLHKHCCCTCPARPPRPCPAPARTPAANTAAARAHRVRGPPPPRSRSWPRLRHPIIFLLLTACCPMIGSPVTTP